MSDNPVCRKCSAEIPSAAYAFCPFCGASVSDNNRKQRNPHRPKSRGNGQGTAVKCGNTWKAIAVVGWKDNPDPSKPDLAVRKTRSGFATKKEAIAYLPRLKMKGTPRRRESLEHTWNEWYAMYEPRIVASTMGCYQSAFRHFKSLHGTYMDLINADDLQKCMDACPAGHRTHQNMKVIAGLLWGYAFDQNIVEKDITRNLFIGRGQSVQRDPITEQEVEAIRSAIGTHRYAEYIYCLCYLGFRPGEMLELKKDMLHCAVVHDDETDQDVPVWYFVNGKKTEAGKDRIVPVPDQILEYVLERIYIPGTDLVFPMYKFKGRMDPVLSCFKPMSHEYFNKHVFKPLMSALGLSQGKVPYCARHTYADKLKNAAGTDKAKAALIGHSQYLFTQTHYQSDQIADLKSVTDSLK